MDNNISALISACRKGNQLAQMQLYNKYCEAMFRIACRYLKNEEDAKDAMQEGFLKAYKQLDKFIPNYTFGAWLKRIIINQCLDVLKVKKLNIDNGAFESFEPEEPADWQVDSGITRRQIIKAMEQLNPRYALVLKLYLLEGYDHEEISEILEIPVKTSRTHLRRGRLKLQDLLKSKYDEARH